MACLVLRVRTSCASAPRSSTCWSGMATSRIRFEIRHQIPMSFCVNLKDSLYTSFQWPLVAGKNANLSCRRQTCLPSSQPACWLSQPWFFHEIQFDMAQSSEQTAWHTMPASDCFWFWVLNFVLWFRWCKSHGHGFIAASLIEALLRFWATVWVGGCRWSSWCFRLLGQADVDASCRHVFYILDISHCSVRKLCDAHPPRRLFQTGETCLFLTVIERTVDAFNQCSLWSPWATAI